MVLFLIVGFTACSGKSGVHGVNDLPCWNLNANLQRYDIDISGFNGSLLRYNLIDDTHLNIAKPELSNYSFFFYLRNDPTNNISQVPGKITINNTQIYTNFLYSEDSGNLVICFYKISDDSLFQVPAGFFETLRIVAIESTTKVYNISTIRALETTGADTDDYQP
ncbi:hypothetical protein [Flagellimonas sp.]|uniref:hypothetical protein n=1 Tax=Flagellimonas sp. TaxID=2058762 RepID=UPI003B5B266C